MEEQNKISDVRCRWLYLRNSYVPGRLLSRSSSLPLSIGTESVVVAFVAGGRSREVVSRRAMGWTREGTRGVWRAGKRWILIVAVDRDANSGHLVRDAGAAAGRVASRRVAGRGARRDAREDAPKMDAPEGGATSSVRLFVDAQVTSDADPAAAPLLVSICPACLPPLGGVPLPPLPGESGRGGMFSAGTPSVNVGRSVPDDIPRFSVSISP
jgi:hypothetical protein